MYNLKYKTIDQLFDSVADELSGYEENGMIDRQQLIKVVQRINKELGLKINKEYDTVIQVKNHVAKLPENFYMMNFMLYCNRYTCTHRETNMEVKVKEFNCDGVCETECAPCNDAFACIPYTVEEVKTCKTYEIRETALLNVSKCRRKDLCGDCPNFRSKCNYEVQIDNGYITTNFKEGTIHINYIGHLEDEEGNLLALDHDMINDYYEYALKERIFENIWLNGEDAAYNRLQYIKQVPLRESRNRALGIARMPEFSELEEIHNYYRKRAAQRYENIIGRGTII